MKTAVTDVQTKVEDVGNQVKTAATDVKAAVKDVQSKIEDVGSDVKTVVRDVGFNIDLMRQAMQERVLGGKLLLNKNLGHIQSVRSCNNCEPRHNWLHLL